MQVDGGAWERAELGGVPSDDTWVQWAVTLDVPEGDHDGARARHGKDGETQTERRCARPTPTGRPGCTRSQISAADLSPAQLLRMTYAVPPEAASQIRSNCARS